MPETSAMLDAAAIREAEAAYLAPGSEGHDHLVWERAHGATVRSVDGRDLIDFTSGVLVANVGHAHPHVADAIATQARRLLNAYDAPHPLRSALARRLVEAAGRPVESVALLTTGAEAIDASVRIARYSTGRDAVVGFQGGFHGKSISASSVSGLAGSKRGLGTLIPGMLIVPFPDPYRPPLDVAPEHLTAAIIQLAEQMIAANLTESPAAFLCEPYLGAGGAIVPPADFLPALRKLADRHAALLILDEVQSGFGRTGSLFAFQQSGISPDLVVAAKGIASGVPMSAVLGPRRLLSAPPAGSLWSTYGGNPLSCAAAMATLDVLLEPGLLPRVARLGDEMASRIRSWDLAGVGSVRHAGLSFGIELVLDSETRTPDPDRAFRVLHAADRHGLVVLPPAGAHANVVRMAPPLVITDDEVERGLEALREALLETIADTATLDRPHQPVAGGREWQTR